MAVDYKLLLAKYIELVGSEEGITFLNRVRDDGSCEHSSIQFTGEEMAALNECSQVPLAKLTQATAV